MENGIHFSFVTNLPNQYFDIFLCDDIHCSFSLSESTIGIPSHGSFKKYSGERSNSIPTHSFDNSPQSLFHLSPYQISESTSIIVSFKKSVRPEYILAQFYSHSGIII